MLRILSLLLILPTIGFAQASSITGTYGIGTARDPGCSLQVAPIGADSVHLQIYCNRGAPTYNSGFLDQRLPLRANAVLYETSEANERCRIRVRFAAAEAVVTQDGTDIACGFGGSVNVAGTYHRISRRQPRFDLNPVRG